MNSGSVEEWIAHESSRDLRLNVQKIPLEVELISISKTIRAQTRFGRNPCYTLAPTEEYTRKEVPDLKKSLQKSVIAMISHDEMKPRMIDFVLYYEHELDKFNKILATGTTGSLIRDAAPTLADKVQRYHSGPKGGDIELAVEILFHQCDVVVFFVDPLHPHPHNDDIRVVFAACMINDEVRMLSNEAQARDWMDTSYADVERWLYVQLELPKGRSISATRHNQEFFSERRIKMDSTAVPATSGVVLNSTRSFGSGKIGHRPVNQGIASRENQRER